MRIRNHELALGLGVCARAMQALKRMHRPGIAAADSSLLKNINVAAKSSVILAISLDRGS